MEIIKWSLLTVLCVMIGTTAFPQQLKLGNSPYRIEKSAVLELQSDNQGLLFSRISDTSLINSLNPSDGMAIFHVPSKRLLLRTSGYWAPLVPSASLSDFWSVNGNSNGSVKKLGNTDNFDLSFITSNTDRLKITSAGNIGINTAAPTQRLEVTGNFRLTGAFMPGNNAGTAGYVLRSAGADTSPTWVSLGLANLADATITTPANGQMLQYNGTKWVNFTPAYLTSIDTSNIANFWVKVRGLFSASAPLTYANGLIGITQASSTTNGYLGSADWNTFNNKLSVVDTSNISNFYVKVRSELSAGTGINYNPATGVISSGINTGSFWNLSGNTGTNPSTNFLGTTDARALVLRTANTPRIHISAAGSIGIGSSGFDGLNPEKLLIDAGTTTSPNLIHAMGSINNYLQLNVMNQSSQTNASSNVVATANNGNSTINFINMGINSSGNSNPSYPVISGVNNSYLYSTGNDLVIGNATAAKPVRFFTGGYAITNERMRIDGTGNIGVNNLAPTEKLDITGNLRLSGAFMPNNNAGSAGNLLQSNGPGLAPTWLNMDGYVNSLAWSLGGNSVEYARPLGTTSGFDLPFITTNTERMRILANGNIGIGTAVPTTSLHVKSPASEDSGLRLENLTSSSTPTAGAATLGVDATGKVVRVKTPVYYSGTGATASIDEVTKIWVAEVANNNTGIVTVTLPTNIGFTNILDIQVTAKGGNSPNSAPIASVTSNTLTSITIRVLKSKITSIPQNGGTVEGLEAGTDTPTRIYIRVEGN